MLICAEDSGVMSFGSGSRLNRICRARLDACNEKIKTKDITRGNRCEKGVLLPRMFETQSMFPCVHGFVGMQIEEIHRANDRWVITHVFHDMFSHTICESARPCESTHSQNRECSNSTVHFLCGTGEQAKKGTTQMMCSIKKPFKEIRERWLSRHDQKSWIVGAQPLICQIWRRLEGLFWQETCMEEEGCTSHMLHSLLGQLSN